MIIWLASYPRSGNTMFRMALKHLYGIDTHSIYADQDIIGMGAADVVGHVRKRIDLPTLIGHNEVYFVKTHNPKPNALSNKSKAIHIVRDGRDVLTSYAHYRVRVNGLQINGRLAAPAESLDDLLTSSAHIWGGWSGHAGAWIDWPGQCVLIKYEDMVRNLGETVDRALNAIEEPQLPLSNGKMPKFSQLSSKWPQFFRKGQIGSWNGFMSKQQLQIFWTRHGTIMRELDYV